MKIRPIAEDVYSVEIDSSHSVGILHCTNEISLTVRVTTDEISIIDGWEITSGEEIFWEPGEEKLFETMHAGVLKEIFNEIVTTKS